MYACSLSCLSDMLRSADNGLWDFNAISIFFSHLNISSTSSCNFWVEASDDCRRLSVSSRVFGMVSSMGRFSSVTRDSIDLTIVVCDMLICISCWLISLIRPSFGACLERSSRTVYKKRHTHLNMKEQNKTNEQTNTWSSVTFRIL